jgi:hypothetical protein
MNRNNVSKDEADRANRLTKGAKKEKLAIAPVGKFKWGNNEADQVK